LCLVNYKNMYNTDNIKIIIQNALKDSNSMSEASSKTTMNFKTFRKYAKKFGLYVPNQSGKGTIKPKASIPLKDILSGLYPNYQTFKLAKRILSEGIKPHKCEECKLTKWLKQPIPLELDHIDGNPNNHKLKNLRLLCPNCHAQTPTYRGKNIKCS